MFAVLNVYKPAGCTSHDVVARLRRCYGLRRIGHLGTLDPLAEGVLPVCLGSATRLIEYFPSDKEYLAMVGLGLVTETLDAEGATVSATSAAHVTQAAVDAVLAQFVGDITQEVPRYSATHVGGKKLYEYARQGREVELPVKQVHISELTRLQGPDPMPWPEDRPPWQGSLLEQRTVAPALQALTIEVRCGTGTYIRALARDIGEALGCGGYLASLIRTRHGRFAVADATPLETILAADDPTVFLAPPRHYLAMPAMTLANPDEAVRLASGQTIVHPHSEGPRLRGNGFYWVEFQDQPLAVAHAINRQLKPLKVFASPNDVVPPLPAARPATQTVTERLAHEVEAV
jgi:tRNA pseudouridine55 synthase